MRLTKRLFLRWLRCPASAWHTAHHPDEPTAAELQRMREGHEVGQRARLLYPHGALVDSSDFDAALIATRTLIPVTSMLFEAAFAAAGCGTRADILRAAATGNMVEEVKACLGADEVNPDHVDDLAFTTCVMQLAGLSVAGAYLLRLSRHWRFGDPIDQLFVRTEMTRSVLARAAEFRSLLPLAVACINAPEPPAPRLCRACRDCDYFGAQCHGAEIAHPLYELPRLSEAKLSQLVAMNITEVENVPQGFALTDVQRRVADCVKRNVPHLYRIGLANWMSHINWPAACLDFETFRTALPRWPGIACHEAIPVQYSVHVCGAPGSVDRHHEFLADGPADGGRALALQLLSDLRSAQSIIVYSSYERSVLTRLANRFPDLTEPLTKCIGRLVDLEQAIGRYYDHPGFRGRTSIKAVAPVVIPDITYDDLEIRDGDTASAMLAQLARGEVSPQDRPALRAQLLRYCERDTVALVRLLDHLHQLANGREAE